MRASGARPVVRRERLQTIRLMLEPTQRSLDITTDDARVAAYIVSWYGAAIARAHASEAATDRATLLTSCTPAEVTFNGEHVRRDAPATGKNPWTSGGYIVDQFVWRSLAADPEWLAVYGCAVEIDGRAFVFSGSSGAGKTTLACALAARGAKLYGDEMTVLHRATGTVGAFARRVMIRDGTLELLGNEAAGRAAAAGPAARAPLGAFALVERGDDAPAIASITPAIAARESRARLSLQRDDAFAFPAFSRLLANTRCYRVTTGSPHATAAALYAVLRP